jgi:hypothetical protein
LHGPRARLDNFHADAEASSRNWLLVDEFPDQPTRRALVYFGSVEIGTGIVTPIPM